MPSLPQVETSDDTFVVVVAPGDTAPKGGSSGSDGSSSAAISTLLQLASELMGSLLAWWRQPDAAHASALALRVALHCGPVHSGVVGVRQPRHRLFGGALLDVKAAARAAPENTLVATEPAAQQLTAAGVARGLKPLPLAWRPEGGGAARDGLGPLWLVSGEWMAHNVVLGGMTSAASSASLAAMAAAAEGVAEVRTFGAAAGSVAALAATTPSPGSAQQALLQPSPLQPTPGIDAAAAAALGAIIGNGGADVVLGGNGGLSEELHLRLIKQELESMKQQLAVVRMLRQRRADADSALAATAAPSGADALLAAAAAVAPREQGAGSGSGKGLFRRRSSKPPGRG